MKSAGNTEGQRRERGPLIVRELEDGPESLIRALLRLDPARRVNILDGNGARPPDARFLIAGFDPFEIIEARAHHLRITRRDREEDELVEGDVLELLDKRLESHNTASSSPSDLVPVAGGVSVRLDHRRSEVARDGDH